MYESGNLLDNMEIKMLFRHGRRVHALILLKAKTWAVLSAHLRNERNAFALREDLSTYAFGTNKEIFHFENQEIMVASAPPTVFQCIQ